jgi:hypothetical protein
MSQIPERDDLTDLLFVSLRAPHEYPAALAGVVASGMAAHRVDVRLVQFDGHGWKVDSQQLAVNSKVKVDGAPLVGSASLAPNLANHGF